MAKSHGKNKGRRDFGTYSAWPHECAQHSNFLALSPHAKVLLFYFVGQYRGKNNGDLSCAWGHTKDANLGSRNTIDKARAELEMAGWIVRTRQGSVNRCCLYALTFLKIDECDGKLDEAAGIAPLGFWKSGTNPWLARQQKTRPQRSGIFSKRTRCATLPHQVGNPSPPGGNVSQTFPTSCAYPAISETAPSPPAGHLSTSTRRSTAERVGDPDCAGSVDVGAQPLITLRRTKSVRDRFPVPPAEAA